MAIQRKRDRPHRIISPATDRIESIIRRAVGVQTGQVVKIGYAVVSGKITADNNLAGVRRIGGINRHGIHGAVGAQTTGIEVGVRRTVIIQPADAVVSLTVQIGERTGHEGFAGATDKGFRQGVNGAVRAGTRIEEAVQRAVRIQTGKAAEGYAVKAGKQTAHENVTIRLHGHGAHRTIGTVAGRGERELGIQGPIRIQTGHAVTGHAVGHGEITAHQQLVGADQGEGINIVVKTGQRTIGGISTTGRFIDRFAVNDVQGRGTGIAKNGGGTRQLQG